MGQRGAFFFWVFCPDWLHGAAHFRRLAPGLRPGGAAGALWKKWGEFTKVRDPEHRPPPSGRIPL